MNHQFVCILLLPTSNHLDSFLQSIFKPPVVTRIFGISEYKKKGGDLLLGLRSQGQNVFGDDRKEYLKDGRDVASVSKVLEPFRQRLISV